MWAVFIGQNNKHKSIDYWKLLRELCTRRGENGSHNGMKKRLFSRSAKRRTQISTKFGRFFVYEAAKPRVKENMRYEMTPHPIEYDMYYLV